MIILQVDGTVQHLMASFVAQQQSCPALAIFTNLVLSIYKSPAGLHGLQGMVIASLAEWINRLLDLPPCRRQLELLKIGAPGLKKADVPYSRQLNWETSGDRCMNSRRTYGRKLPARLHRPDKHWSM